MKDVIELRNAQVRKFSYTPKRTKETKEGPEDVDPFADLTLRITGPEAQLIAQLTQWAEQGEIDIAVQVQKRMSGSGIDSVTMSSGKHSVTLTKEDAQNIKRMTSKA